MARAIPSFDRKQLSGARPGSPPGMGLVYSEYGLRHWSCCCCRFESLHQSYARLEHVMKHRGVLEIKALCAAKLGSNTAGWGNGSLIRLRSSMSKASYCFCTGSRVQFGAVVNVFFLRSVSVFLKTETLMCMQFGLMKSPRSGLNVSVTPILALQET